MCVSAAWMSVSVFAAVVEVMVCIVWHTNCILYLSSCFCNDVNASKVALTSHQWQDLSCVNCYRTCIVQQIYYASNVTIQNCQPIVTHIQMEMSLCRSHTMACHAAGRPSRGGKFTWLIYLILFGRTEFAPGIVSMSIRWLPISD